MQLGLERDTLPCGGGPTHCRGCPVPGEAPLPADVSGKGCVDGVRADAPAVVEAVYLALLYADVFDFPLTPAEVFTFLPCCSSQPAVAKAIESCLDAGTVETDGIFLFLAGRSETAASRRHRATIAGAVWPKARRYGRLIWALPYVRMVAVTGSLAVDNAEESADIDYLVVTAPGRLWLTRGLIVLLSKLARRRGDRVCPNYLVTTDALELEPRDIYTAHELAQMVPLHGTAVARQLWSANRWCLQFLPNAQFRDECADNTLPPGVASFKRVLEVLLRLPPGEAIERWERKRKIARLSREAGPESREARFSADICKGHIDGHGGRVLRLFASRIAGIRDASSES